MSPAKRALLDALTVERQHNPWWPTVLVDPETFPIVAEADDELLCAQRRRQLAREFDAYEASHKEAR